MKKRKIYKLRDGDVLDFEEYHDGKYGARGKKREKKKKRTSEQQMKVNLFNKMKRCRWRLLQYFCTGDIFATWTYEVKERPPDMEAAKKDFKKAMEKVRKEFRKRGYEVFWIRNIERGTKGAWHIHLVINEIGDTAGIIQRAWDKGGTWSVKIRNSKFYDEDFTKLAEYMTKCGNTQEVKADGTPARPRIKESSYFTSRNMPLPEPEPRKIIRWVKEPKPRKGYYIARIHEGTNPATKFKYRRYTMIRLNRRI